MLDAAGLPSALSCGNFACEPVRGSPFRAAESPRNYVEECCPRSAWIVRLICGNLQGREAHGGDARHSRVAERTVMRDLRTVPARGFWRRVATA